MSSTPSESPPQNLYAAADWLRGRHPWLDHLVTRLCGDSEAWVDEILVAFNVLAENDAAWRTYESAHPAPQGDDETRYFQWQEAGPQLGNPWARDLAPMSSGEKRILRLVTTLAAERCTKGWHVDDLSFDDRGWAIVMDWIAIVQAQR